MDEVVLSLKDMEMGNLDLYHLLQETVPSKPEPRTLANAFDNLKSYGILDQGETENWLTPLGKQVAKLGVEPRLGKLALAGAEAKCIFPALAVAGCLNGNEMFLPPTDEGPGDEPS